MKYILIIFFFLSCSSSRKIKTELHIAEKKDSVVSRNFDSTSYFKEAGQDNKELTIEYDASRTVDTVASIYDGDTFISIPTKGLKSIRIRHSSSVQKVDSTKVVDQSFSETHSEIKQDQKTETTKKNEVELPSFNFKLWGIIAGVLLPLLIGGFIWWKKRKKSGKPLRNQTVS